MARPPQKNLRRQQILDALSQMLESKPGERVTTAALAEAVGVSEAALYRHFPSKSKMFDGLLDAVESAVFSLAPAIISRSDNALMRCERILFLLLSVLEEHPGATRLLTGEALHGEAGHLRDRVGVFFARLETLLHQTLREGELKEGLKLRLPAAVIASMLLAAAEGRLAQFARSNFRRSPSMHWRDHCEALLDGLSSIPAAPAASDEDLRRQTG